MPRIDAGRIPLRIERHVSDGVTVVSIAEPTEIDAATADSFKEAVAAAIDDSPKVVLDISRIEFFDSAGMGALLGIQKRVAQAEGRLVLTGQSRAVREVFQMVGFDLVFDVQPDVPLAVAALNES
jgi:anti-sigma B factor antagonist